MIKFIKNYWFLIFLILSLLVGIAGCVVACNYENKNPFLIVEYDGCEYIKGYQTLSHKGNCKYCLERNKK